MRSDERARIRRHATARPRRDRLGPCPGARNRETHHVEGVFPGHVLHAHQRTAPARHHVNLFNRAQRDRISPVEQQPVRRQVERPLALGVPLAVHVLDQPQRLVRPEIFASGSGVLQRQPGVCGQRLRAGGDFAQREDRHVPAPGPLGVHRQATPPPRPSARPPQPDPAQRLER